MFPTLRNGDKILLKYFNISEIAPLDIVVYKNKAAYVCHRVYKIREEGDRRVFYTKGDFNFFSIEKVEEAGILGKIAGIYRKGRFKSLRLEKAFGYYVFISIFSLLKEAARWHLEGVYNFYSLRWLLKKIAPLNKQFLSMELSEDREDFLSFYNFFPFDASKYEIELRLMAKYKGHPLGKLWIVKNKEKGSIFIYGPYVKLSYRARYIGRDLVSKAMDILKNNLFLEYVYVSIPRYEKQLISFYGSLGFTEKESSKEKGFLLMHRYLF